MSDFGAFSLSVLIPLILQRLKSHYKDNDSSNILEKQCTISAPGKILIAGGYLVLERPNVGVTISATARFHSSVEFLKESSSSTSLNILVNSPQFGSEYRYSLSLDAILTSLSAQGNPFVEKCLSMTFAYIRHALSPKNFQRLLSSIIGLGKIQITLQADNDFYSQMKELDRRNLPYLSDSLRQLPPFLNCPRDCNGELVVAKTGMGSSAALTTSLVASLLQFFGVINLEKNSLPTDQSVVHNLGQLIHSVAQGKIGSGFDVAAAVYGSQFYRRFSDTNIPFDRLINNDPTGELLYSTVRDPSLWNQSIVPFHLPVGMDIVMGDVCGGSSSSSMAKAVLAWKAKDPEHATTLWNRIRETNERICHLFRELSHLSHEPSKKHDYVQICANASKMRSYEWSLISCPTIESQNILNLLLAVRDSFILCRSDMKLMGQSAGTDIEPDQQTRLADATANIPGVLCSGVPGAGGVDAIYALVLSPEARTNVELMWSEWREVGCRVCPLVLSVDQGADAGIHVEI